MRILSRDTGRTMVLVLVPLTVILAWQAGRALTFSPNLGIMIPTGMVAVLLAVARPEWILYLVLSVGFSFIPYNIRIDVPFLNSAREILIVACLVGAIFSLLKARSSIRIPFIFAPLVLLVLFEIAFALMGRITISSPWGGILPGQFRRSPMELYFLLITVLGGVLTLLLVDSKDKARMVLLSILGGVALRTWVTTAWLLYQQGFFTDEIGVVRRLAHIQWETASLSETMLFGGFLPLVMNTSHFFPVFLVIGLHAKSRPLLRVACLSVCAAMIVANSASGLRAGLLALAAGTAALLPFVRFWLKGWLGRLFFLAMVLAGVSLVLASPAGLKAWNDLWVEATTGVGGRAALFFVQLRLFLEHPMWGSGFRAGHSTILDWATGMGSIYLIPAAVAICWPLAQLWRLMREGASDEDRALFAGLFAGWVSILTLSAVSVVLTRPEPGFRFWSLAVVIALWRWWQIQEPEGSLVFESHERRMAVRPLSTPAPERLPDAAS